MSEGMNESEVEFSKFLNKNNFYYMYVDQTINSFSDRFRNEHIKRPDFLVGFKDIGIIAIDVKDKSKIFMNDYKKISLDYDDVLRAIGFERAFHIPYWFAISSRSNHYSTWYMIPARTISELASANPRKYIFENNKDNKSYLAIPSDKFIVLDINHDSLTKILMIEL